MTCSAWIAQFGARERSAAKLDAPSASQPLGCCKQESSSAPPASRYRSRTHAAASHAGARTNAGPEPRVVTHLLVAKNRTVDHAAAIEEKAAGWLDHSDAAAWA
jgi:hypothetical protein